MNKIYSITLLLIVLAMNWSQACSCAGENSVKKELKNSKVVFEGKVIEKKRIKIGELFEGRDSYVMEYKFEVLNHFKGRRNKSIIKVMTGVGSGDCGFNFIKGKSYIVYAKCEKYFMGYSEEFPKFLYTDICTRTQIVNEKELLLLQ